MPASPHRDAAGVADHYDRLNRFYVDVWGLHRHHGCWESGRESTEQAIACMAWKIIEASGLAPGGQVADAGCGAGGLAWLLADVRDAQIAAYTLSEEEKRTAEEQGTIHERNAPEFHCCDWLDNDLPEHWADAVLFVESLSHMSARKEALEEAVRVLNPGGRLVIADWMYSSQARQWHEKYLLEPICRSGKLAGLVTLEEHQEMLNTLGLKKIQVLDLSDKVSRTWRIILSRLSGKLLLDKDYRKLLWKCLDEDPVMLLSPPCILLAYALGCLKYSLLVASK